MFVLYPYDERPTNPFRESEHSFEEGCHHVSHGFFCTRPYHAEGQHIAGNTDGKTSAVWNFDESEGTVDTREEVEAIVLKQMICDLLGPVASYPCPN